MNYKATKITPLLDPKTYLCKRCGIQRTNHHGDKHPRICLDCKPYQHEYQEERAA